MVFRCFSENMRLAVVILLFVPSIHACETIGSWKALVAAVKEATNTLSVCPFDITKPSTERLMLNKRLSLTCHGATETNKCILRGTGHHFRIAGAEAEVVIDGFAFHEATECAVRVLSTAMKKQELRNCDFVNNAGRFGRWRGGAIKTELDTNLALVANKFIGNSGGQGGAIFHRGNSLVIIDTLFRDNVAKQAGAIQADTATFLSAQNSLFVNNTATVLDGGAIVVADSTSWTDLQQTVGSENAPCNGVYNVNSQSCSEFINPVTTTTSTTDVPTTTSTTESSTTVAEPFVPGNLTQMQDGLLLSSGLTIKVLARAGEMITFTSPERFNPKSSMPFHAEPDGAAVFELEDGGWAYMSNCELPSKDGGVFSLEFDSQGRPRSYTQRLSNTSRNCAGGATPWGTWVSCEEFAKGQCWQVHPTGNKEPEQTELVEAAGGNFESMAVDNRNPSLPVFFVTEDHARGALRRFTPCGDVPPSWEMLHHNGTIEYLEFLPNNRFHWTMSLSDGRDSADQYFQNVEGISHDDGTLSFVSKIQKEIFHLDLDAGTYTKDTTVHKGLSGGGDFGAGPDQLLLFADVLYFTEDGGKSPGIYAHDGSRFYALVEGFSEEYFTDETTGFAFSPDGTKLYFCLQQIGYLFELERKDGLPFDYSRRLMGLRFRRG